MSESAPGHGEPTVYVCVDVEASGPIPNPYNLVSIGAVPLRQANAAGEESWSVDEGDLFYIELQPLYPGFDPGAMAIHGLSRQHLERNGTAPRAAMERFGQWAGGRGGRPVFVGHNAVFDWAFINHYFNRTQVENPFGWKALDTKSMAAGALGIPFLETSKENLARLLPGVGPEDLSQKHRADYDALYQARLLAALLRHSR
ncbi:MAG: exonuclease domain-containing protein [Acidobacteriota bacterium]